MDILCCALALLGGVIGVIVGLSVSFAICMNTDITFSLNTFAIGLGVGFSAAVGIIFGWAPARKASRLNPIDALRSMYKRFKTAAKRVC